MIRQNFSLVVQHIIPLAGIALALTFLLFSSASSPKNSEISASGTDQSHGSSTVEESGQNHGSFSYKKTDRSHTETSADDKSDQNDETSPTSSAPNESRLLPSFHRPSSLSPSQLISKQRELYEKYNVTVTMPAPLGNSFQYSFPGRRPTCIAIFVIMAENWII